MPHNMQGELVMNSTTLREGESMRDWYMPIGDSAVSERDTCDRDKKYAF